MNSRIEAFLGQVMLDAGLTPSVWLGSQLASASGAVNYMPSATYTPEGDVGVTTHAGRQVMASLYTVDLRSDSPQEVDAMYSSLNELAELSNGLFVAEGGFGDYFDELGYYSLSVDLRARNREGAIPQSRR